MEFLSLQWPGLPGNMTKITGLLPMIPNGKSINGDVAEIWKVKDGKRDSRTICLRLIHLKLIQNDAIEGACLCKPTSTFWHVFLHQYLSL